MIDVEQLKYTKHTYNEQHCIEKTQIKMNSLTNRRNQTHAPASAPNDVPTTPESVQLQDSWVLNSNVPLETRHFLFKTSSGTTPLFSSSAPGYPLTSGTVYSPPPRLLSRNAFSRNTFKLKKPSKYCSWKCAAVSAIGAALLLAVLLCYFIAMNLLGLNWQLQPADGHVINNGLSTGLPGNSDVATVPSGGRGILHKGNGENLFLTQQPAVISSIMGNGRRRSITCPSCSGLADGNKLLAPVALAAGIDGSLYIGDLNFVRRVFPSMNTTNILELR
ncbi:Teneurin-2 [Acipenser ruthenus]|uniref:Teneurin-2 n=1 Tax=Acipenser ruthenus TaxID=7906 RepID=A0A662YLY5_ACIRT|nr:Teneurin-2 [Acipenser ruthenus]